MPPVKRRSYTASYKLDVIQFSEERAILLLVGVLLLLLLGRLGHRTDIIFHGCQLHLKANACTISDLDVAGK